MILLKILILPLALTLAGGLVEAQQPPAAPTNSVPAGGLVPEWDNEANLKALSTQAQRLKPILEQVKPLDWVAKGAPQAYVRQLQSTQNELGYMTAAAQKLAQRPEKLSVALETLFRMEALEKFLGSLAEGIRKYQNPALADLLQGVQSENWNNREKLRQYVVDLATTQEQQLQVMDQETQRCRLYLSRQPAAPKNEPAKRTK
ncbi:MAG: hypothetical protein NTY38_13680 [Acidobacteria bacterium]|nr:hypothetical protein [Acidobacteriota bacterium]